MNKYKQMHVCHSHSKVNKKVLKLLQEIELEQQYKEASKEIDSAYDITASDGLDDETW